VTTESPVPEVPPSLADDFATLQRLGQLGPPNGDAIIRVLDLVERLKTELVDMVSQACSEDDGTLYARGLSSNRDAMYLLEELGLVKITGGVGRCITAEWAGELRRCNTCLGQGKRFVGGEDGPTVVDCPDCGGTGKPKEKEEEVSHG
jgi:hypothetical protein